MLELDHINLFVAEVSRSRDFYLSVLGRFGYTLVRDYGEAAAGLGTANYATLALVRIVPPVQPIHLAFRVSRHREVEAFHRSALGAGARDHGAPGPRPEYHPRYYAAFVLDPDGHNLEVVCHGEGGADPPV